MKYFFDYAQMLFLSLVTLIIFSSCEDVVDVALDTGQSTIVIDAEILWQSGTDGSKQTILISKMTDYYNQQVPKVTGAEVFVENQYGQRFEFKDIGQGVYQCTNFNPELDVEYTLTVAVGDQLYTATEVMEPVSEILQVVQTVEQGFSGEDEIEVQFKFQDPADQSNYYLSDFETNILFYPEYELTDDDLYNGNVIKIGFSDEDLKIGDTVKITHRGISEQFYNYMNLILETTSGNPFATPPGNIRGNILNENEPGAYALGYFRLSQSDVATHIIE
ncbi:DUF4249 domain-containing protein [Galbibacter sp.]|uniref:DUF4249 domain-containing protein n=1 Tax=Galbibacter sp. TaxID=2918471 RepID=UPI002B5D5014|nr:DUF4249 domain-containing protein [Galbibacter sp.]HLV62776.1 DUF4249 domain-containing protein [Galbibacter sp.]